MGADGVAQLSVLVIREATARRRLLYLGKLLRLPSQKVKAHVRRYPALICLSEKGMSRKVKGLRRAFGFSEGDWRRYVTRFPQVLTYDVARMEPRIEGHCAALNVTRKEYRLVLMRSLGAWRAARR